MFLSHSSVSLSPSVWGFTIDKCDIRLPTVGIQGFIARLLVNKVSEKQCFKRASDTAGVDSIRLRESGALNGPAKRSIQSSVFSPMLLFTNSYQRGLFTISVREAVYT